MIVDYYMCRLNSEFLDSFLQVEDLELSPIVRAEDVPIVVHGTNRRAWEQIKVEVCVCVIYAQSIVNPPLHTVGDFSSGIKENGTKPHPFCHRSPWRIRSY